MDNLVLNICAFCKRKFYRPIAVQQDRCCSSICEDKLKKKEAKKP